MSRGSFGERKFREHSDQREGCNGLLDYSPSLAAAQSAKSELANVTPYHRNRSVAVCRMMLRSEAPLCAACVAIPERSECALKREGSNPAALHQRFTTNATTCADGASSDAAMTVDRRKTAPVAMLDTSSHRR